VQQTFRSYNVLVIEDNAGDAGLIKEAFAACGKSCNLTFASNPQAGRDLLSTETFDLVVSDLGYASEDGADFIRHIRADSRLKSLPVVVLSGSANPQPAYEAGANAFVTKSVDLDSFNAKIKALMHFWVEVVELPRLVEPNQVSSAVS
jgi:CheY-like chemotaxis protein